MIATAPHCDPRVLHEPLSCEYCDLPEYQPLHQARTDGKIAYTGRPKIGLKLCPSDEARGVGEAGRAWYGNRAKPKGCTCSMFKLPGDYPCPFHQETK